MLSKIFIINLVIETLRFRFLFKKTKLPIQCYTTCLVTPARTLSIRGHTLITLAHRGTYLVCKMLTTVL